uniref:ULP_PROTEASE domain-containing protein n=1 Tax=Caenorhabditis tropicalis TaxID=1561998 RepID=A0A1I7TQE1_9PELO
MCSPSFKLSYESVVLDAEDIKILETSTWFNDKLLTFMGEYLMNSMNGRGEEEEEKKIHVFSPSETEMIRHSPSQMVEELFGGLGVDRVPIVAWIMSNNEVVTRAYGGSHWSLLVFHRPTKRFHHFDSFQRSNERAADSLRRKTRNLVDPRGESEDILETRDCIQQTNSSDCGLFVAQFLATLVEKGDPEAIGELKKVEKTRKWWRDFILNFEME